MKKYKTADGKRKVIPDKKHADLREAYHDGKISFAEFNYRLRMKGYSHFMIDTIERGLLQFTKGNLRWLFKTDAGNWSIKKFDAFVNEYPSSFKKTMIDYFNYYDIDNKFTRDLINHFYENDVEKIKLRPDTNRSDFFEELEKCLTEWTFAKPHEVVDILYNNLDTGLSKNSISTYRKM